MRLRVRGPEGMAAITLDDTATWADLRSKISESTGVPDFDIKYGYPPKALNMESIDAATKLSDLDVKLNGEQLTIMSRNIQAELSAPLSGTSSQKAGPLPPQNSSSAPKHQSGDFPDKTLNLQRTTRR